MKHLSIFILLASFLLASDAIKSQEKDYATQWKEEILQNLKATEISTKTALNWDLSHIISNKNEKEYTPFSSYVGVFGTNYQRIDFHLTAQKDDNSRGNSLKDNDSSSSYTLSGKSKLGKNIRDLKGTMTLSNLFHLQQPNAYIAIFDYRLSEPGDRNGDGVFEGVFATIFYKSEGKTQLHWAECGDFREYNNTFVGKWKRFNTTVERKCIFTFKPVGLYNKLPFCEDLYCYDDENEDLSSIKEQYLKYGWHNFEIERESPKARWWENKE